MIVADILSCLRCLRCCLDTSVARLDTHAKKVFQFFLVSQTSHTFFTELSVLKNRLIKIDQLFFITSDLLYI